MRNELVVAGAGPISAAVVLLAAVVCFAGALVCVLLRRSVAWIAPVAITLAGATILVFRAGGGVVSPREDAIAAVILCAVGALIGAGPVAFAAWFRSWVRRVFRDTNRRLADG